MKMDEDNENQRSLRKKQKLKLYKNTACIDGRVLSTDEDLTFKKCKRKCLNLKRCVGLSYLKKDKRCMLFKGYMSVGPQGEDITTHCGMLVTLSPPARAPRPAPAPTPQPTPAPTPQPTPAPTPQPTPAPFVN